MIPKLNRLHEAASPLKAFEAKWKTAFKAFGRDVDALNKKHGVDPKESEQVLRSQRTCVSSMLW